MKILYQSWKYNTSNENTIRMITIQYVWLQYHTNDYNDQFNVNLPSLAETSRPLSSWECSRLLEPSRRSPWPRPTSASPPTSCNPLHSFNVNKNYHKASSINDVTLFSCMALLLSSQSPLPLPPKDVASFIDTDFYANRELLLSRDVFLKSLQAHIDTLLSKVLFHLLFLLWIAKLATLLGSENIKKT